MMKKLFLVLLLMLPVIIYAQELKYSDIDSLKSGEFTSYQSKDGAIYKVGDRLKIGVPSSNKTFGFIYMTVSILAPPTPLTVEFSGTDAEIKKIFISGTKRAGYRVYFKTKGLTAMVNYSIVVENALANGELKSFGKTSDEALTELKKAKDKLDLGLINQVEYDKIKIELVKYIK